MVGRLRSFIEGKVTMYWYLRFNTRNDCKDLPTPRDVGAPLVSLRLKSESQPPICIIVYIASSYIIPSGYYKT